jgi:hypothetical protein
MASMGALGSAFGAGDAEQMIDPVSGLVAV